MFGMVLFSIRAVLNIWLNEDENIHYACRLNIRFEWIHWVCGVQIENK